MKQLIEALAVGLIAWLTSPSQSEQRIIKEIHKMSKLNQERIDALTAKVESGNTNVENAIKAESAEIKAAIASPDIDTTKLEAAVARNESLAQAVSDIFTPDAEAPVDPVDPVEETDETEDEDEVDFEDDEDLEDEDDDFEDEVEEEETPVPPSR